MFNTLKTHILLFFVLTLSTLTEAKKINIQKIGETNTYYKFKGVGSYLISEHESKLQAERILLELIKIKVAETVGSFVIKTQKVKQEINQSDIEVISLAHIKVLLPSPKFTQKTVSTKYGNKILLKGQAYLYVSKKIIQEQLDNIRSDQKLKRQLNKVKNLNLKLSKEFMLLTQQVKTDNVKNYKRRIQILQDMRSNYHNGILAIFQHNELRNMLSKKEQTFQTAKQEWDQIINFMIKHYNAQKVKGSIYDIEPEQFGYKASASLVHARKFIQKYQGLSKRASIELTKKYYNMNDPNLILFYQIRLEMKYQFKANVESKIDAFFKKYDLTRRKDRHGYHYKYGSLQDRIKKYIHQNQVYYVTEICQDNNILYQHVAESWDDWDTLNLSHVNQSFNFKPDLVRIVDIHVFALHVDSLTRIKTKAIPSRDYKVLRSEVIQDGLNFLIDKYRNKPKSICDRQDLYTSR
ncbi:hypothetical protein CF386_08735 [Paraphotobacterium marinum]|uniref:Uncharacterized protein n=1 Tax=Paraphotobacterium marinum TaxID=1755811 RepID=A0A220VFK5_9GAMM|nr:hypothetical protein [Paraphotobacterium marinum]ASK79145.1 hypothetical protein CF386_08735 [Paraphotobacterium marinum]